MTPEPESLLSMVMTGCVKRQTSLVDHCKMVIQNVPKFRGDELRRDLKRLRRELATYCKTFPKPK